jgi:sugar phosphate isomerase/epimerase
LSSTRRFESCFSSLGCPELTLGEVLALAQAHGLGAVEIRALNGDLNLPGVLAQEFGSREDLRRYMDGQAVRVAVVGASLRLIGATELQIDELVEEALWADALGATHIRVFDGGSGRLSDEQLRALRDTLAYWQTCRARHGISVDMIVETHDSLADTGNLQRFLDAGLDVPLLWDTHHTWKIGGEDPATTWARVARSAVHLHVKDSVADATARHGHRYVIPGTGDYPFAALNETLEQTGYSGLVSLEWEAYWHPDLPPLADALAGGLRAGWMHPTIVKKV